MDACVGHAAYSKFRYEKTRRTGFTSRMGVNYGLDIKFASSSFFSHEGKSY